MSPRTTAATPGSGSSSRERTRSPGCSARSADERGGEQAAHRGRERGDPQLADHLAALRLQVRLGQLHLGEDARRVLGEQPARVGEPHPAAVLREELLAHLALQLGHLLGDRRRRDVQPLGRTADRAVPGEGVEGAQALQIQHVSDATAIPGRKSRLCYEVCCSIVYAMTTATATPDPRPRLRPPPRFRLAAALRRPLADLGLQLPADQGRHGGLRPLPGHPRAAGVRHGGARGGDGGEAGAAAARGADVGPSGGRRAPAQRAAVLALRLRGADDPLHARRHLQRDLAAVGHGAVPGRPLRGPADPASGSRGSASASSAS